MKRILTIAITVAAIAAFAVACGPDKSDDKKLEANNSFVYDKTNTPIGWAGVYEKDNVYTIWLATTAPAVTTMPITIENGIIITLPTSLLGTTATIGSGGVTAKLNTFDIVGTSVTVNITGTTLSVVIPEGTLNGKYFTAHYDKVFTVVEDEVIPETPFVDLLVGYWDVTGYIIQGTTAYLSDHVLKISKINATTIEIAGFSFDWDDVDADEYGDKVRATVDNENKTILLPANWKLTPSWDVDFDTYLLPMISNTFMENIDKTWPPQTFTMEAGALTMRMKSGELDPVTINGGPQNVDYCVLAISGTTSYTYGGYFFWACGTTWVKQSATGAPSRVRSSKGHFDITRNPLPIAVTF